MQSRVIFFARRHVTFTWFFQLVVLINCVVVVASLSCACPRIQGGLGRVDHHPRLAPPDATPPSPNALYVLPSNSLPHTDHPVPSLSLMTKTHPRSPSPEPKTGGLKRLKIGHSSDSTSNAVPSPVPGPANPQDVIACFAPDLFDTSNVDSLAATYSTNEPFKHALIDKLFCDHLLHKVKDECLSELHFTEKETDIYKVRLRRPSLSPFLPSC